MGSFSKLLLICLCFITSFFCFVEAKHAAVTYTFSGGRFGDNLLSYYHAKWISYKYDIPLYYQAFGYSDKLALHDEGVQAYMELCEKHYQHKYLGLGTWIDKEKDENPLYICSYFPENQHELNDMSCPGQPFRYFAVDWEDEGFRKELRRVVQPKETYAKLDLPKDRTTVAVHIRQGGGFDPSNMEDICPLKFCPLSYYVTELKRVHSLLKGKPLHVYVFTDDPNPSALTEQLKGKVGNIDITYDCRKQGNSHSSNVLEDFFALTHFDCLIRTHSNFSLTAGKIADYLIEISPVTYTRVDNIPVIDSVDIRTKGKGVQKVAVTL